MKRNIELLVFTLALLGLVCSGYAEETIPAEEAGRFIDQQKTVCGEISSGSYIVIEEGQPTSLYFSKPYPDQAFTVTIPGTDRAKFVKPPEELYTGKRICVTGNMSNARETPDMVVTDPSQIRIEPKAPEEKP